jgi:hypothetical protein
MKLTSTPPAWPSRLGIALLVVLLVTPHAAAQPTRKLMVLQSEGTADARTRAKVDAAIAKLAATGGDQVAPGEITYGDAAALVGCNPDEASCRDEVIASLGVDELVVTTVNARPPNVEVSVKRIGKAGAVREASATVAAGAVDKLDPIAPLFTGRTIGPTPPVADPSPPVVTDPPPGDPTPDPDPSTTTTTTPPPTPEPTTARPLDQPADNIDYERRRNRLRIGGMAAGGGMVLVSFIFWGAAAGVENDVANFQVRNAGDLQRLRDLEHKGDSYADFGNLFFIGGLALGGVSAYYYLKARRKGGSSTTSARFVPVPMIVDGGGGIALTFGGVP